jgi:hypothetical protein
MSSDKALLALPFFLVVFVFLATANSAGYRYGAGDLGFYGPAVMRALDPQLFPGDAPVINAQARLTLMDETVAAIARLTTRDFPTLFLGLYAATLTLLAVAVVLIGGQIYRSKWAVAALLAAVTLRHAIPKSGTNTLEAYFHPRQLAFAFGLLAVAAFLRGRNISTAAALTGAALLHPTTTLWFAIWLMIAILITDPRSRVPIAALGLCAVVAAAWAFRSGPLAGRLVIMDAEWLDAIAEKDYLFPLQWSAVPWIVNLAFPATIWLVYRRRAAAGVLQPRETGLVIGVLSLVVVFLVAVALNAARVALAIQLQPARVFWMLDFLAIAYGVWAIADAEAGRNSGKRAMFVALALLAVSALRGGYIMLVQFPDRRLFEVNVRGDWERVTTWAQTTPTDTEWLAHPNHAARYGTSLRMAGRRDVFVEVVKDAALGMYDRAIAIRTRDRLAAIGDFATLSEDRAHLLASQYRLDYLISEHALSLPEVFRSGTLHVYRLR